MIPLVSKYMFSVEERFSRAQNFEHFLVDGPKVGGQEPRDP